MLLLCVSDDAAVDAVMFGPKGGIRPVARRCGAGLFHDCAEYRIAAAERLAQQGVSYLDAPVTGGTEGPAPAV